MKVLLDECVPHRLRIHLSGHDVHTAQWAGFAGKKNGELLRAAEAAAYEVLVSVDRGSPYQQAPRGRNIAIVILSARTDRPEDLVRLGPALLLVLDEVQPGEVRTITAPDSN